MSAGWDGLVLLDKPEGPTSHDLVARVRRATGQRRVGHTGTLDPMATGLMVVVLGRATRLIRYLPAEPKGYAGILELGRTTSSDDVTGETLARATAPLPPPGRVGEAARTLLGESDQRPPAVSARKVGGQRLYALARQGVQVEVPPRRIRVDRFDLTPTDDPACFRFEAQVSSGTYIRALARDLGERLGCGGTLASLRRTAIAPWRVGDAIGVPESSEDAGRLREALVPLSELPLLPRTVRLPDSGAALHFRQGRAVEIPDDEPCDPADPKRRVLGPDGALLGIGEAGEDRRLRPRVVIPDGC